MKQNLLEIVTRLIEIAWRRRTLLLVPIAIMVPLSIFGSRLLPQTYVAKALLAMQESGSDNPLIKSTNTPERVRDRAPGLQALLKSDRVMVNALRDILGDRMPTNPREVTLAVRDLDSALSFEMIGTDFLEFQLKGSNQRGLGRKLEAVTSRFLESLVATDQDSMSATQMLLEKRREDVTTAEKALLRFQEQLGERVVGALAANEARLKERQANLQATTTEIAAAETQIAALRTALGAAAAPENAGHRENEIRLATVAGDAADKLHTPAGQAESQAALTRAAQLTQLQSLEARTTTLRRELEQVTAEIADQGRAAADGRSPEGQLRRLQRDVTEARVVLESYSKRFPSTQSSRSLQVLNAPERIRVIDAPRDPEFPTTSRLRVIVGGSLLGVLMALALTAGAEMLDQRLRYDADFEAAVGAPVIARLPPALSEPAPEDQRVVVVEPTGSDQLQATSSPFGRRSAA